MIVVEVENLENSWGKRKFEKARRVVEEGICEGFHCCRSFNSRLFETSDHMIFRFDNFGSKWKSSCAKFSNFPSAKM